MGETVEQGGGHLGIAKDRGPFAEAEVGGDDDAGPFVEFAQQMEQQCPARGAERQVAQFVQDHEVELGHCLGNLSGFSLGLFLFEGVDQFDGGEEAHLAAMMLDGLNTDGRCNVGFAGARAADEDHVLRPIHELAAMQAPDGGFIDLAGGEVEPGEVFVGREAR